MQSKVRDENDIILSMMQEAGFTPSQMHILTYQTGPYDIDFPTSSVKNFIELIRSNYSMNNPVKYSYSQDEIIQKAKQYCIDLYGKPMESGDKDKWMERFGLLCSFLIETFPEK